MHTALKKAAGRPRKVAREDLPPLAEIERGAQRLQVIALHQAGRFSLRQIARILKLDRAKVTAWVRRWEQGGLQALIDMPKTKRAPHIFTLEARAALLEAVKEQQWKTAREAYGYAWNTLGLRITYVTVWRFLTEQGLLVGDKPHARQLVPPPKSAPPPPVSNKPRAQCR